MCCWDTRAADGKPVGQAHWPYGTVAKTLESNGPVWYNFPEEQMFATETNI